MVVSLRFGFGVGLVVGVCDLQLGFGFPWFSSFLGMVAPIWLGLPPIWFGLVFRVCVACVLWIMWFVGTGERGLGFF